MLPVPRLAVVIGDALEKRERCLRIHPLYNASIEVDSSYPFSMNTEFRENMLLRSPGSKSVYVTKNGKRYSFGSAAHFMSHGYDFGDVVTVSEEDMNRIEHVGLLP